MPGIKLVVTLLTLASAATSSTAQVPAHPIPICVAPTMTMLQYQEQPGGANKTVFHIQAQSWAFDEDENPQKDRARNLTILVGGEGTAQPVLSAKVCGIPKCELGHQFVLPCLTEGWAWVRLEQDPSFFAAASAMIESIDVDLDSARSEVRVARDTSERDRDEAQLKLENDLDALGKRVKMFESRLRGQATIWIDPGSATPPEVEPEGIRPIVWWPLLVGNWIDAGAAGTDVLIRARKNGTEETIEVAVLTTGSGVEARLPNNTSVSIPGGKFVKITYTEVNGVKHYDPTTASLFAGSTFEAVFDGPVQEAAKAANIDVTPTPHP